jgi:hypothetical protein
VRPVPAKRASTRRRWTQCMLAAVAPRRGRRHPSPQSSSHSRRRTGPRAQAGQRGRRSAARHGRHGSRLGEGLSAGGAWAWPPRRPPWSPRTGFLYFYNYTKCHSSHTREMKMLQASWAFTAHETSDELVIGPAHVHNTRLDSSHFLRAKVNILLVLNYLFFLYYSR